MLIDCPPRITTATINALSTASHLLIPTQPDGLSIPGAEYFSRQLMRMREEAFPALRLLGVIPSITLVSTGLRPAEETELRELELKLSEIWPSTARAPGEIVMRNAFVPRTQPIRDAAGKGIAYFRNAPAKQVFARAAEEVWKQL